MPGVIPKGDIIFSFDLTGSMADELAVAKTEAINIMNSLDSLISDAQYAVISYMDYPAFYSSCGYSSTYGSGIDYAYDLNQPLTSDKDTVADVINSLNLGNGNDGPQDYTRIFYESYSDPGIGHRTGAKRVLLNIGDNIPHDCNLNEGVPGKTGTRSTGVDPGRDAVTLTADDLDLQTVLSEMATNGVTLLELHGYSVDLEYWEYWTSLTGGALYQLGSAEEIPQAIDSLIKEEATHISSLTLEVTTPGYESWLTSVNPSSYADITLPATRTFNVVITVPSGITPGTHIFNIGAIGDGASYGDHVVIINVITDTLVGYWKFDEGTDTIAYDSSGFGNDGVLKNGPTWVNAECGKALSFDGIDDYVQSISVINPIPTTAHTFTLWFKPNRDRYLGDGLGNWGLIEGGYAQNSWNHHYLFIVPGSLYYYYADTDIMYLTASYDFTANIWYFVAITADGGNRKLYINGIKVAESTDGTGNSDELRTIVVGAMKYFGISDFFNGTIDEVKIYNKALSEVEIGQEYEKCATTVVDCNNSYSAACLSLCPAGDIPFNVFLRDSLSNPVLGYSNVWLDFSNCAGMIPCTTQTQWPIVFANSPSDSAGKITFNIKAGGCASCYAYVHAGCGVIDSVLVKSVDINGDLFVKPTDWDGSLCNDYNCDGVALTDFDDFNLHQQHVGHSCASDPCLLFHASLTVQPDTGLQVGDTASVCAVLQNNSTGTCRIDSINFYSSGFSVGDSNLALFSHLVVNQNLSSGDTLQRCATYVVPGAGQGCITAKFYTNCCSTYVEAEYCVRVERLLCPPDTVFHFITKVDTTAYYFGQFPIARAAFSPNILPAWSGVANKSDSLLVTISVDGDLAIPGDSFLVYLYLYKDPNYTSLLGKRTFKVTNEAVSGDVNDDCKITLSDVIYLVNYIFNKPKPPCQSNCWAINPLCLGDVNGSGGISLSDVIYLVNFIFNKPGGPWTPLLKCN
jgi:hypothetical protein